jgi:hypothetical protein
MLGRLAPTSAGFDIATEGFFILYSEETGEPFLAQIDDGSAMSLQDSPNMPRLSFAPIPLTADSAAGGHTHPSTAVPAMSLLATLPAGAGVIGVSASRDQRADTSVLAPALNRTPKFVSWPRPQAAPFPGSPETRQLAAATHEAAAAGASVRAGAVGDAAPLPAAVLQMLASAAQAALDSEAEGLLRSGVSLDAGGLRAMSKRANAPSHVVTAALRSVLTDPLAVVAQSVVLASGRGLHAWPLLLRLLLASPQLAPVALRQAYLEQCGFGVRRALIEFEVRLRARSHAAVAADQRSPMAGAAVAQREAPTQAAIDIAAAHHLGVASVLGQVANTASAAGGVGAGAASASAPSSASAGSNPYGRAPKGGRAARLAQAT